MKQEAITIAGVNVETGDRVRWVPANSSTCSTNGLDPQAYVTGVVEAGGALKFSIATPGLYEMCYQWRYASTPHAGTTEFTPIPGVKLLLIHLEESSILPRGTAIGCATKITIIGAAFDALPGLVIRCSFGPESGELVSTLPLMRNDTHMLCQTPTTLTQAGTLGFYLAFGTTHRLPAFAGFSVEDLSQITIESALPAGGPYNTKLTVTLRGTGFKDLGGARCRFGNFMGEAATILGNGVVKCPKPAFPDSVRDEVGSYPLSYSPNGQCFATVTSVAANANSISSFTTYNALLKTLYTTGAPANTEVVVGLIGSGFPIIPGGLCIFTRAGESPIQRNATVLSETTARCSSPRGFVNGVSYYVSLLLNGVTLTPNMGDVGGTLYFKEYDLSLVRVTSIFPPGGPTWERTAVTLSGSGFASYGENQLICEFRETGRSPTRVFAELLGTKGEAVLCPFEASAVDASVLVKLSLNNGTSGTFSADSATFVVYPHANLSYITPQEGDANGGNEVSIFGHGFTGLAPGTAGATKRSNYLRCKFAGEVQLLPPTWHNDTLVVCKSTWGKEDPAGQVVSVALNGDSFDSSGNAVRYVFKGLNKPAMVETYFPADAQSLIIQFDSQPTNRANMNGQHPCSRFLNDATVTQLKGSSTSELLCEWMDDSKVMVLLDLYTNAAPGMTVGIKANVIWPKAWAYPGSCDVANSMCTAAISIDVSENYPCDVRDTPIVELCVQPVALVQAPEKISSCPGTPVSLTGTNSYGSGIKPLSYQWAAHPTKSDNYYSIQPAVCGTKALSPLAMP